MDKWQGTGILICGILILAPRYILNIINADPSTILQVMVWTEGLVGLFLIQWGVRVVFHNPSPKKEANSETVPKTIMPEPTQSEGLQAALRSALPIVDELLPLKTWNDKQAAIRRLQKLREDFRANCQGYIDDSAIAATDKAITNMGFLIQNRPPSFDRVTDEQARALMEIEFERRDGITKAKELLKQRLSELS